ncbi:hypothetical protein, partial [Ottowia sp.]|uniref:hypothetical protein n=1 Tax=Ottowia sp. TaxID=1898956 RepID=UPI00345EACCB
MKESRVPERAATTHPIKAPGADVARVMGNIGNAERVRFGDQGGHVGFAHTFSGRVEASYPGVQPRQAQQRVGEGR